jgi:hypothetical protein
MLQDDPTKFRYLNSRGKPYGERPRLQRRIVLERPTPPEPTVSRCPHCGQMVERAADTTPVMRAVKSEAAKAVEGCGVAVWELVDAVLNPPGGFTGRKTDRTARALGYSSGTGLSSMLNRKNLPSYAEMARRVMIVRLADLLKTTTLSRAANDLGFSSPQAAGRMVRLATGRSMTELRRTPTDELAAWAAEPWTQHAETWRTLKLRKAGPHG